MSFWRDENCNFDFDFDCASLWNFDNIPKDRITKGYMKMRVLIGGIEAFRELKWNLKPELDLIILMTMKL